MKKLFIIRFETNLNASMQMKIMSNSYDNAKRQILKHFPNAFNYILRYEKY